MKKIFTLAAAFMATALSFQAVADSWVVTTSAEFTTALGSLGRKIGARDTIFVKPESADVVISSGTYKTVPTAGKFWVTVYLRILSLSCNFASMQRLVPKKEAISV